MKKWTLFTGLILAALILASCGAKKGPLPYLQPNNGASTQPAAQNSAGASPVLGGKAALDNLTSYRTRMTWQTQKNGTLVSDFSVETEETRNPQAMHMVWKTSGTAGTATPGGFEMIQIGDQSYMNLGGNWMKSQQNAQDAASAFGSTGMIDFNPETTFANDQYSFVGNETINGVNTKHYSVKINPAEIAMLSGGMSDMTDAKADVWVADAPGLPAYTAKYTLTSNGKQDGQPASFTWQQEVYDVNQPFTIQVPAEAANSGLPADVPTYPGATNAFTMSGVNSFSTTDDSAKVMSFYQQQLATNGWATDSALSDQMVTYKKDNRTLTLTTAPKDGGGTDVTIMIAGN
jgi:hypothetical protein